MPAYATGQLVNATINGVAFKNLKIMESRYRGFDVVRRRYFEPGTQIAFYPANKLNKDQIAALYGDGKVFSVTAEWPLPEADAKADFVPSEYQEAIFESLMGSDMHILINALAGSGKTSTLIWLVKELAKRGMTQGKNIIYLAFNKSIAEELTEKLMGTGVPAQTTHSFGRAALTKKFGFDKVKLNKYVESDTFLKIICDDNGLTQTPKDLKLARKMGEFALKNAVLSLVGYIKAWAIIPTYSDRWAFSAEQIETIKELVELYQIEFSAQYSVDDVVKYAARIVVAGLPEHGQNNIEISFDDMLYVPLALDLPLPKFDLVLTDESQDFNACQIKILEKLIA